MSALFELYANALIKCGWHRCINANLLEKNGCLFCDHENLQPLTEFCNKFEYDANSKDTLIRIYRGDNLSLPVNNVKSFQIINTPNKCTWHVESAGWVLKRGYYSNDFTILISDPLAPYALADFQKVIDSIDEIAQKTTSERRVYKMHKVSINKQILKKVAIPEKSNIEVGVIFRVTRNFVDDSLFRENNVYEITLLSSEGIIITAYNKKLVITSQMYKVDYSEFNQLINGNYIECIKIKEEFEDSYTEDWVSCNFIEQSDKLPNELVQYAFSKERTVAIATAYKNSRNYAAFLNQSIKDTAIESIYALMNLSIDTTFLCNKTVSKDTIDFLVELSEDRYYVPGLPVDYMSRMDLEDYLENKSSEIKRLYPELSSMHFSVDQKHLLTRLLICSSYDLHQILNESYSINIMFFIFYCVQKQLDQNLIDTFLTSGMENADGITLMKRYFSATIKAFIRTWLKVASNLVIQDTPWDSFIEQNLECINSIDFKLNTFIFRTDRYSFCRDDSSVSILNSADIPIWRAVLVNNTFVVNREHENEIYF